MKKRLECRAFEQLNLHDKRRRLLFSWSVLSCRRYTLRRENSLRRWCGDLNRNRRISEVRFPSLWSFSFGISRFVHWNLRGYRDCEESVFFWRGRIWFDFQNQFWQKKSEKKKKNLRSVSTVFCIWRSWTQIYCFRFPFICFSCFFSSFRWLLSFLQKALLDFIFRMRLDNVGSIGGNRCEAFNSDRVSKISKLFFSKCCINLSWQFITNHYFSFSSPCLSLLIFFIFLQKPSAWGRM